MLVAVGASTSRTLYGWPWFRFMVKKLPLTLSEGTKSGGYEVGLTCLSAGFIGQPGLPRCPRPAEAGGATVQGCGRRPSAAVDQGGHIWHEIGRWAAPGLFRQFSLQLLLALGEFLADPFDVHTGGGKLRKQLLFLLLDVPLYHLFEDSNPGIK